MPLVLGIDEAGYGPMLGPLVVAGTLWRVPPEAVGGNLWTPLKYAVCRKPGKDGRLPVGDSKQVFDRKKGLCTLERTVLAFAQGANLPVASLAELLTGLGDTLPAQPLPLPWYANLTRPLPSDPARSAYAGAARRLARAVENTNVRCCGLRVQVVTEDRFNTRLLQTDNKAAVLLEALTRIMLWATSQAGDQDVYLFIDRQGGRIDYRRMLMDTYPERHLHVVVTGETVSQYRLASQRSDWHVEFRVEGERRHLPIALASMTAKYVRELLMDGFNTYWKSLAGPLRPTAGYHQDAERFLNDIEPLVPRSGLDRARFVRIR